MKLAVNFSPQAAELLSQGRIEIDLFKCPDWPGMIAEARRYRPVAVHFTLKAGNGALAGADWEVVERLLAETGTPYVNLHLDPSVRDFPGMPAGAPQPEQFERVVEALHQDVAEAARRFGGERVILENVPYRGEQGKTLRPAVMPEVICQVVEEHGCGLLLDISHARIAAHHLGMEACEYMSRLPVQRLAELHFTGLHLLDGRLQDHLPALDTDWPVLAWVLEQISKGEWKRPWMLAFEYGGVGKKFERRSDPDVMAEQIPRLYRMVNPV